MSERQFVKARYDPKLCRTELLYVEEGNEKALILTDEMMHEIVEGVPLFNQEKEQLKILVEIHRIIKDRVLIVEELDKKYMEIIGEIENSTKALKLATRRNDVYKFSTIIQGLRAEKTLVDSRRELLKQLQEEESKQWAKLAESGGRK
jgi:predicted transcriptional regulator